MFVRFRSTRTRLQASLIETRRVDGKVRAEHVAALGSIAQPANVIDRVEFWQSLHERLGKLANRLPDPMPVYGAIQARIPMPTADEQRAAMLETAEADARLWESLRDLNQSMADDNRGLAGSAESKAVAAQEQAESAKAHAEAAADRVARLKRGETINGGLHRPFDIRQAFRDAGWTERDMAHAIDVASLSEAQHEEYIAELVKRGVKAQRRIKRALPREIRSRR